ncbi:unnamed protein product [Arabidopsis thaliana]|uniref:(thale cress) hypothetical protein n=1 Tax=Arabidopsis thaliana TaxID=3702 RepID=A0A7G2EVV5_ARATH|nr:unnamed protein product [Arabidopsis thaliana]
MKKRIQTNLHFDYGGYYTADHEWSCKNSVYGIVFKTSSLERITYADLIDNICRKIALGGQKRNLKLSYKISKAWRESYIVDNEDVLIYLTSLDKEGLRPVLHVELCSDLESNNRLVPIVERRSSCGVNYGELAANVNTCSCREFDIDKYPCVHAIAAAIKRSKMDWNSRSILNVSIYGLCSKYYLIETWALAYYRTIYVMPHQAHWFFPPDYVEKVAKPPDYTPKKGRNQETRFPSKGEKRRKKTNNKATRGINLERWLQPETNDD